MNFKLAEERGLSIDTINLILRLHDEREILRDTIDNEAVTDDTRNALMHINFTLQHLWGFPIDISRHHYNDTERYA